MIWSLYTQYYDEKVKGHLTPELHVHACMFHLTCDQDSGTWYDGHIALPPEKIEAMFNDRFADRIEALGYPVKRSGKEFEVVTNSN